MSFLKDCSSDTVADSGGGPIDEAFSNLLSNVKGSKKLKEKTLKSGGSQNFSRLENEMEKLMSPENLKPILRAPADLMLVTSGRELWNIPESELNTLAYNASLTGKYFAKFDPKWLALAFFGYSLAMTYGVRAVKHMQINKQEQISKVKTLDEKEKRELK